MISEPAHNLSQLLHVAFILMFCLILSARARKQNANMFATCARHLRRASHLPRPAASTTCTQFRTLCDSSSPAQPAPNVTYETQGNVAIICLVHPATRNALGATLAARLADALHRFEQDASAAVAVLHGSGGCFSTGTDMKQSAADVLREFQAARSRQTTTTTATTTPASNTAADFCQKPIVCGIGGYCVGSGLELALRCDLRVVEEDATLGFFNRRYGVPLADAASAGRLSALVGRSRAADLLLTGRAIGGREALELGVANRVVATGTSE